MNYVRVIALGCTLSLSLALGACGGGGNGDSALVANPPGPAGTLQLAAATATVDESGTSIAVTVSRAGGTEGALTATVATADGSATAGQDYTAQSVTLTFAAGDASSQTVSIPISNDTQDEPDESVLVSLTSSAQGTPNTATVTIVDDDPPGIVQLNQGTFSIGEGGGSVVVGIVRGGDSSTALSVNIATQDGSALAGQDYEATAATVTFATGDATPQSITVPILNDADAESDEAFTVVLSGVMGGAVLGSITSATLTIPENDQPPNPPSGGQPGSLQLSAASYDVSESGGNAIISVTRVGGSGGAVSATLSTGNGSATAGSDYTALNTTVSFAAGDATSKLIALAIASDVVAELAESFSVTLSAPTGGATLGTPSTASILVQDNDRPVAPALSFGVETKRLRFDWLVVPTVTAYRLYLNPNGASGFTQVGADLPPGALSTSVDLSVHRFNWANASVRLEACNVVGCTASANLSLTSGMLDAIGYLKAAGIDSADRFGASVATSADGNIVAVGVPGEDSNSTGAAGGNPANNGTMDSGAVYVYAQAQGIWEQQAYLKASITQIDDALGTALALSGDGTTLAAGAAGAPGRTGAQGIVYVFTRSGSDWTQRAAVSPPSAGAGAAGAGDQFGSALALSADGNSLVVGAAGEDNDATGVNPGAGDNDNALNAGAAYAYARSGDNWTSLAFIKASNAQAGDRFGASVALNADGSTLAIGAVGEASGDVQINGNQGDNTAPSAGATYVFSRAGGVWTQNAYLKSPNAEENDEFGGSLALSADGNTLAIGAALEDGTETGALAFPIPPPPEVPPPPPPQVPPVPPPVDPLPTTFRGLCDAPPLRPSVGCESGAVYVFVRAANVWSAQAYIKGSNNDYEDRFGTSVSLSSDGNSVAIGSPREDSGAAGVEGDESLENVSNAGAAYAYVRSGAIWTQQAYVKAPNTDADDVFASAIALSADAATLVVGATGESSSAPTNPDNDAAASAGAAYLY